MTTKPNSFFVHALGVVATVVIALAAGEVLVRLKNLDQRNYYVEMWRYGKYLKQSSPDPMIGHIHVPGKTEQLQNVEIAINSRGMRGPEPVADGRRKVLFLGSSITLGWGVAESDTLRARLERDLGGKAQVLNAGIGNYNSVRYVSLFEKHLTDLKPDVVVVQYFLRDAEDLSSDGEGNRLFEHSMLATLGYHALLNATKGSSDISSLVGHYGRVYAADSPGRQRMEAALARLAELSAKHGFKVILAMTPDIHQLSNYPFANIHSQMAALAKTKGWGYVDFLDGLSHVPAKELYAIPGDPHPNALGHRLMAEALRPLVQSTLDALP